jgi:alkyl hydroperoxide reductase subunit AhpC/predicted Ser/Thr protein kinase
MVGTRAPGFDLPCTSLPEPGRQRVALADFLDRWLVLVFYPRDFSLVCPTELTALSARIEEFRRRDCDVVGVSTDSVSTHERWLTTPKAQGGLGGLEYPLASDEDGTASRAYGVYVPRQHVASRGLFIIDPNGVLQYQVVHNLSVGRRTDEVLRVLDALQTGGLCSSEWERDAPTLDPTASLHPNSRLGPYRIEAELGHGSFGAVYRAYDTLLERKVALKVLRAGGSANAHDLLREARAAAALIHPNVCAVFSVDASESVPLIVMEYLDGRPLSKLLEDGPLPEAQATAVARQIGLGMAAAHALGIVHGDLKPANIMITQTGSAKILDFGLAHRGQRPTAGDETLEWPGEGSGTLSGTPGYMSPEQARGLPTTTASDVFSLGLILYEMRTGRRAIAGDNLLQVLHNVERVPAVRYADEVAGRLGHLIRRALVADPVRRELTMAQIAEALE